MNHIDLSGRAAIITGGGSGIGLATAKRFLGSGAVVEIWGRDQAKLEAALASVGLKKGFSFRCVDVSDHTKVEEGVAKFLSANGRLDILFNNAGVVQPTVSLTGLSIDEWRRNFSVNLDAIFFACRVVVPIMTKAAYGRIINTASMAGKEGNPFQSAYSASKAGVIGLTKSLGKELATTGVTVNCIVPALFETPLAMDAIASSPEAFAAIREKIPMKRLGRPDEAAAMVAWLASEESSFTTGCAFDLSGGRATY
jgi:NAD(P)-dependent dehydrogenase (short-subunit alcohol dehydrogenase family)